MNAAVGGVACDAINLSGLDSDAREEKERVEDDDSRQGGKAKERPGDEGGS